MTLATAAVAHPALRHRLAERGVDRQLLLLVPAVLFLVLLFAYPFLYGLQLSFAPAKGGPFASYATFFSDAYQRGTIWTTLGLALPAALINVVGSVPIAYRMRGAFRGKRLLTTVLVVPITLGTVLTAQGLLNFLGPAGWFNKVLVSLGLTAQPVQLVNNYWGVFFSLVITGFPFAFLLIMSYLSGIDPTLERAAATLGADRAPAVPADHVAAAGAGSGDDVLPVVRAGVQRVPVGDPGGQSGPGDAGDLDRGVAGASTSSTTTRWPRRSRWSWARWSCW